MIMSALQFVHLYVAGLLFMRNEVGNGRTVRIERRGNLETTPTADTAYFTGYLRPTNPFHSGARLLVSTWCWASRASCATDKAFDVISCPDSHAPALTFNFRPVQVRPIGGRFGGQAFDSRSFEAVVSSQGSGSPVLLA